MTFLQAFVALAPLVVRLINHVVSVTQPMSEEQAQAYIKDFIENPKDKFDWTDIAVKDEQAQWH